MSSFENILVGVDLSHGDWLATEEGETPSHFACDQAVDLAAALRKAGGEAKLYMLAALDLDERTKWLLEEMPNEGPTVLEQAEAALERQVAAAVKEQVPAEGEVVLGSSRVELVNAAKSGDYDVVMIGSRGHGLWAGILMGSTALELLRKSPCPVWVVKPGSTTSPRRILVGTDFSPVCNALLDRGVELAKLLDAELHVTHVVEHARRPFLQFSQVAEEAINKAHDESMARARAKLDELAARPDVASLTKPAVFHLKEGSPSVMLVEQTSELDIDLLLMGTVAWAGVPGLVIGSTAHKLLPALSCSLLTMRPTNVD